VHRDLGERHDRALDAGVGEQDRDRLLELPFDLLEGALNRALVADIARVRTGAASGGLDLCAGRARRLAIDVDARDRRALGSEAPRDRVPDPRPAPVTTQRSSANRIVAPLGFLALPRR
jgi:hypothetical protein